MDDKVKIIFNQLLALEDSLPKNKSGGVSNSIVESYHSLVQEYREIAGEDVTRFLVPESDRWSTQYYWSEDAYTSRLRMFIAYLNSKYKLSRPGQVPPDVVPALELLSKVIGAVRWVGNQIKRIVKVKIG